MEQEKPKLKDMVIGVMEAFAPAEDAISTVTYFALLGIGHCAFISLTRWDTMSWLSRAAADHLISYPEAAIEMTKIILTIH